MSKLNFSQVGKLVLNIVQSGKIALSTISISVSKLTGLIQVGFLKLNYTAKYFFNAFYRDFDDNTNTTDSTSLSVTKNNLDVLNLSESNTVDFVKNSSDALNLQENFDRTIQWNRQFIDDSVLSDSTSTTISLNKQDTFTLSDTLQTTNQFYRSFTDTTTFTDDINGAAIDDDQIVTLWKPIVDYFNISDNLIQQNSYYRQFNSSSSITDDINLFELYKVVYDITQTTDVHKTDIIKNLLQELNVSDNISQANSYFRNFQETTSLTDGINYFNVSTNKLDTTNISEYLYSDISKVLANNFLTTDSVLISIGFLRSHSDNFNIFDTTNSDYQKSLINTGNISDYNYFSYGLNLSNAVNLTDDVNGAAVDDDQNVYLWKTLYHTAQIYESHVSAINKLITDSFTLSSSGVILLQGYGTSPEYFLEDYTGSSTTIS